MRYYSLIYLHILHNAAQVTTSSAYRKQEIRCKSVQKKERFFFSFLTFFYTLNFEFT